MNILGIRFGHDASVSLLIDGEIVADVAEERFTRIKNDGSFPLHAIDYCLKVSGLRSEEIDVLAVPAEALPNQFLSFFEIPNGLRTVRVSSSAPVEKKIFFRSPKKNSDGMFRSEYEFRNPTRKDPSIPVLPLYKKKYRLSASASLYLIEHHLAHAASACHTSGLCNDALCVTMDGRGDGISCAVWNYRHGKIANLARLEGSSSLAWFYAAATEAMGWRQSSDEWKLMGLSSFGDGDARKVAQYCPEFKDGSLKKGRDFGSFGRWNERGANHYHCRDSLALQAIASEMGHEDFAAAVQKQVEEQAMNLILPWLKKTGTRSLLCAGGFFLNVKFNQHLWEKGLLDNHWVYPNSGDSGIALGAAFEAFRRELDEKWVPKKLDHLFKGPEFEKEEIRALLKERQLSFRESADIAKDTAVYLMQNKVVGWFQGRMEAGPRALGNRSILMSPLKKENGDLVNRKIKYRETFRPFCPSIRYERAEQYLENSRIAEHMVISFAASERACEKIPAVIHVDATTRPQMVRREVNPLYYSLIENFEELSGEAALLNTSFNIKGEPIVCHPRDAIKCFYDTGIDVLVLGDFILEKENA